MIEAIQMSAVFKYEDGISNVPNIGNVGEIFLGDERVPMLLQSIVCFVLILVQTEGVLVDDSCVVCVLEKRRGSERLSKTLNDEP
jgi:hypothetical protein